MKGGRERVNLVYDERDGERVKGMKISSLHSTPIYTTTTLRYPPNHLSFTALPPFTSLPSPPLPRPPSPSQPNPTQPFSSSKPLRLFRTVPTRPPRPFPTFNAMKLIKKFQQSDNILPIFIYKINLKDPYRKKISNAETSSFSASAGGRHKIHPRYKHSLVNRMIYHGYGKLRPIWVGLAYREGSVRMLATCRILDREATPS